MNKNDVLNILAFRDKRLSIILDFEIHCPIFESPIKNEKKLVVNLIRSIIGQQLSKNSANTIWTNVTNKCKDQSALLKLFTKLPVTKNNVYGISKQKVSYIKELIKKYETNYIDFHGLTELSDEDVIYELTKIKGIGPWTAEMFLIFSLKRKDVFSIRDAALVRAVKKLYELPTATENEIHEKTNLWIPYRSIASWYLWRALDQKKI